MFLYKKGYNKKRNNLIIFSIIIACVVLVLILLNKSFRKTEVENEKIVKAQRLSSEIVSAKSEINNASVTNMLETAMKSVVGVSKLKENGETVFQSNGVEQIGIGSGIIVSKNGYILTNEHVSGAKGGSCFITIEDGKKYKGNVVWSDDNLDLAIIKVNMKFLESSIMGNSDNIGVGEQVYTIGNPIGYEFQKTVTSGIISALDRTIVFKENENEIYLSNLIQTDAIINPGNSGGPLINSKGEVLGINTVKLTSADGISFAIPINVVKPIIEKFEKDGKFEEAQIGIFAYDKNVIPYLDTRINFETGIYIAQISLDSPAYKNGLQIGDVITKIDDVELKKMCDLREYIYNKKVGDKVKLVILRNGRTKEIEIELVKK